MGLDGRSRADNCCCCPGLIEIACCNGVSDPETLRDMLLSNLLPAKQAT